MLRHSSPPLLLARSLALRIAAGEHIEEHAHDWPQLVFAARGALMVKVSNRRWVVPTSRALWLPAGISHSLETLGQVWMRTLYLSPSHPPAAGIDICVLDVRPLLRELIFEVAGIGSLEAEDVVHRNLFGLINSTIAQAQQLSLALPMPIDARACKVAERAQTTLNRGASLAELAEGCGASVRTVERLFLAETGLSFGHWRQQARLQHALRRLAERVAVGQVAEECGYESVSAFVSMFRTALGTTPGQYARGISDGDSTQDFAKRT